MVPKRLSILGVGLLGGSIGLAVKSAGSAGEVLGYGHREETIDEAIRLGAIDRGTTNLADAVRDADLVILCTPVGLFDALLTAVAQAASAGAIVTDVGSTKRSAIRLAEERLPPSVRFVGSHPMAGSEKRGVRYACSDLFKGAVCILTPTERTEPDALRQVDSFWQRLGMQTTRLSPEEHDRRLADVSHLPHAIAAALVSVQQPDSFALAGKGFRDMTRIAAGDGGLWRDILLDNRDNVRDSVRRLQAQLDGLLRQLDAHDAEAVKAWLDAAAERRGPMDAPNR